MGRSRNLFFLRHWIFPSFFLVSFSFYLFSRVDSYHVFFPSVPTRHTTAFRSVVCAKQKKRDR